jgi:hypothetical protein
MSSLSSLRRQLDRGAVAKAKQKDPSQTPFMQQQRRQAERDPETYYVRQRRLNQMARTATKEK